MRREDGMVEGDSYLPYLGWKVGQNWKQGAGSASASLRRQGRRFALFSRCRAALSLPSLPSLVLIHPLPLPLLFVWYYITLCQTNCAQVIGRKSTLEDSAAPPVAAGVHLPPLSRSGCPGVSPLDTCVCIGILPAGSFVSFPAPASAGADDLSEDLPVLPSPFFLPSSLYPLSIQLPYTIIYIIYLQLIPL